MASRRTDIDDCDIQYMHEVEGMTQQELADYYGCCRVTIQHRLHPEKTKETSKQYRLEHPEKVKEVSKQWRLENPEYAKEYYKDNTEEIMERAIKWQMEHPESRKEISNKWRLENPEYYKEWLQTDNGKLYLQTHKWWQTYAGKAYARKRKAMRRNLGSIELNNPFPDSEGHHIDETYIIHIPKDLHHSIRHNVFTGEGMEDINTIAFQYITEETFDKLMMGEI